MINGSLKSKRHFILHQVQQSASYLAENRDLFLIHEGCLLKYVYQVMERTLSPNYFARIKDRIAPVNILTRYIDKVSKAYITPPIRSTGNDTIDEILKSYEKTFDINAMGSLADRFANLFKGYAWEIFLHKGIPRLRTIPFDRFWVISEDKVDPLDETIFIKFGGHAQKMYAKDKFKMVDVFYSYTDTEVDAFDSDGEDFIDPDFALMEGVNPYGVIPFVYGNRSLCELIPTQDTDIKPITISIPVTMEDLAGAIMFQCFSIIYGIDVDAENLTMTPNAFWHLKSDKSSDKNPSVGTIKPTVDIDQVVQFVMTKFVFWLETKGVRVGSVGNIDSGNVASGISKIIDEMDTFEIRKENIEFFKKDEKELWEKVFIMNNFWYENGLLDREKFVTQPIPENTEVSVEFDEPSAAKPYMTLLEEVRAELAMGTMTLEMAIKLLHPDWTQETVDRVLLDREVTVNVEAAERNDNNQ